MKKIIIISAKARHGKDSLADYLKVQLENKGQKVVIMHFASYIKSYLVNYYGWDGVSKDEYWRTKLQLLGTDIIKEKLNMKNFHAKRIAEDIQIIQNDVDYVIISDCRFKDELYYMKAMFPYNTTSVKVIRLGFESELTDEQKLHRSETDMDNMELDYTICTKDGLQRLYDETDRVLGKELGYITEEVNI